MIHINKIEIIEKILKKVRQILKHIYLIINIIIASRESFINISSDISLLICLLK